MIFYYSPGACSLAVHVALEEAGIEYEPRRYSTALGQNRTPEFARINKWQRVPAIEWNGRVITEAGALLTTVANLDADKRLLFSPGSLEAARVHEWCYWLSSSLHIAYAQLWRPERFLPAHFEGSRQQFEAFATELITTFCAHVETAIDNPYVVGDKFTIADAYLLPFYRWGWRIGLEMQDDYPNWTDWCARVSERPGVARALASEGIAMFPGLDDS